MSVEKIIDKALASGMLAEDILEAVTIRLQATRALAPPQLPEAPRRPAPVSPPPVVPPIGSAPIIDAALASGMRAEDILAAVTRRLSTAGPPGPPRLSQAQIRAALKHLPPASLPLVPAAIPGLERYEDLGPIGVGGMAEVRRVRDLKLGRTLALKIIHASMLENDFSIVRFMEEAQATAQLQHPGIVPVHDVGTLADGRCWFTMKEIDGQTLSQVIRAVHDVSSQAWRTTPAGWNLRRLVEALVQVCDAIAYAHERGVLHRDLKPSNVMVGKYGEVLVLDWGLVKVAGGPTAQESVPGSIQTHRSGTSALQTRLGVVSGTPAYMSPEQAQGRPKDIDARTDIYALGAILYTILAGRPPYTGNTAEVVVSMVNTELPRPLPHRIPLPPALVETCMRAMHRDPSARYQAADAMARELRAWLDGARRRRDALGFVEQATSRLPEAAKLRERAVQLRTEAACLLADIETWRPERDKLPAWRKADEAVALDRQAELMDLEVERLLQGALTHAPDLPEAHAALAARYRSEHAAAETANTDSTRAATRFEQHLAALPEEHPDRTKHAAYLRGDGALTLVTDPPGATVFLHRYVVHNRRLVPRFERSMGQTPLYKESLPIGSYLCILRHPDRAEVHYPVCIGRGEHWHGVPPEGGDPHPVSLPRQSELGPDDCYIPAGWFQCGGDPNQDRSLPARRLWVDGQVFRRVPVTNQQYMSFLEDLVAQGRESEALEFAPREWAGISGGQGALIYRYDGGRFSLKPDVEGDIWEPEWPVCMIDSQGAAAFAMWERTRTGHRWQLPGEVAWEKAARGVDGRFYPWGDDFDPSWSCMRLSHRGRMLPKAVGSFPADESPYGILDLAGNMVDWCADISDGSNPQFGPNGRVHAVPFGGARDVTDGSYGVRRGGCWFFSATNLRATHRYIIIPTARSADLGFRLARPYP